jgi:hypothetical protein
MENDKFKREVFLKFIETVRMSKEKDANKISE